MQTALGAPGSSAMADLTVQSAGRSAAAACSAGRFLFCQSLHQLIAQIPPDAPCPPSPQSGPKLPASGPERSSPFTAHPSFTVSLPNPLQLSLTIMYPCTALPTCKAHHPQSGPGQRHLRRRVVRRAAWRSGRWKLGPPAQALAPQHKAHCSGAGGSLLRPSGQASFERRLNNKRQRAIRGGQPTANRGTPILVG